MLRPNANLRTRSLRLERWPSPQPGANPGAIANPATPPPGFTLGPPYTPAGITQPREA